VGLGYGLGYHVLIQRIQGTDIYDLCIYAVGGQFLCRFLGIQHLLCVGDDGDILALADDPALAQRDGLLGGNFALGGVKGLLLEEHHGVVVVDGGEQQSQGVLSVAGVYDLQAGNVGQPGFKALAVLGGAAGAAAGGQTHHHGQVYLAAEHIAHLCGLVHQLIHTDGKEVVEHQLSDRAQAGGSGANGGTDDGALGNGGIAHALGSELVEHAGGHAEAAAESAYIFTEKNNVGILAHPDAHCLADGFSISHHTHLTRTSSTISE